MKSVPGDRKHVASSGDSESRRNMKWSSFAKPRCVLGFDHLSPAYTPAMTPKPRGMAVVIESVIGWKLPRVVDQLHGSEDLDMSIHLSMSLFHLASGSFFGSTWIGGQLYPTDNEANPQTCDLECKDIVYLISRITDASCIGIIEVIVTKYHKDTNLVVAQYGCGWTILNLFSAEVKDISDLQKSSHEAIKHANLFYGSPRDLIHCTSQASLAAVLKEIPGCILQFKLFEHKKLLRAQSIINENEIVGRYDVIAGLNPREVVLPNKTQVEMLCVIGEEERLDKEGSLSIPAKPSVCANKAIVKVSDLLVDIPARSEMEKRMSVLVSKNLKATNEAKITNRMIRFCLHNGHSVVGSEWISRELIENKEDTNTLMCKNTDNIELEDYVPHELMAVAVVIEYELAVAVSADSHLNSNTVLQASLQHNKLVTTLCVGATIFIPCDGKRIILQRTSWFDKVSGHSSEEHESQVDLDMRIDDICSMLTTKPTFRDLGDDGDLLGFKQRLALFSKPSRKSEAKQESNPLKGVNIDAESEVLTGIIVECVCSIVDADGREMLQHGESVSRFLGAGSGGDDPYADGDDDGKPRRRRDSYDNDDDNNYDNGEKSDPKGKGKVGRHSRQDAPSRKEKLSPRYNKVPRDDDAESISDSVVNGSSETSSINLDYKYYTFGGGSSVREVPSSNQILYSEPSAPMLVPPRSQSSLMLQALQAKLSTGKGKGRFDTEHDVEECLPVEVNNRRSSRPGPSPGPEQLVRDLSRGSRSRLHRHGVDAGIRDDVVYHKQVAIGTSQSNNGRAVIAPMLKDVSLEARDPLSLHDISIQFVAYKVNNATSKASFQPRYVYCTFKFYTCNTTKTEVMRLLPAEKGQAHVLVRDTMQGKDIDGSRWNGREQDVPNSYRFSIDVSTISPLECFDFASYLYLHSLYIDVWDADSQMLVGSCSVPLRRLMRQQQPTVKYSLETDVINPDMHIAADTGCNVVRANAPLSGDCVASLQVVLCNYGDKGSGNMIKATVADADNANNDKIAISDALGWRAFNADGKGTSTGKQHRPKTTVRARPLADSSPELSTALKDWKDSSSSVSGPSSRSLLSLSRGGETNQTLTYDEIMILFKKFQGTVRGTVQYVGKLMQLMDVPSMQVAIRKLVKVFQQVEKQYAKGFEKSLMEFADPNGHLSLSSMREAFQKLFESFGIPHRSEELRLLAHKFLPILPNESPSSSDIHDIHVSEIYSFCKDEADRQEWSQIAKTLRNCIKTATIRGVDIEQLLSRYDENGDSFISVAQFRQFLTADLIEYVRLSAREVEVVTRRFGEAHRHRVRTHGSRDCISLPEVMAFLGRTYVGNLEARLKRCIRQSVSKTIGVPIDDAAEGSAEEEKVFNALKSMIAQLHSPRGGVSSSSNNAISLDDLEQLFRNCSVYEDLSHEQVRKIISTTLDPNSRRTIFIPQLLKFVFDGRFVGKDQMRGGSSSSSSSGGSAALDAEGLLRLLLDGVTKHVNADQAFRHFDIDGNGSISSQELEKGLDDLGLFDNIPNWKAQIPSIVKKFDSSGDGNVQLKEFFKYLGYENYTNNILQTMTRVFAEAVKSTSLDEIFSAIDGNGDGDINAEELQRGLISLNLAKDLSVQDSKEVVGAIDRNGDGRINKAEFVEFFGSRIKQATKERARKRAALVEEKFRGVMVTVVGKGAKMDDVFAHLDKDRGGSIDQKELFAALKAISQFSSITEDEVGVLFDLIDTDKSGTISVEEFKAYVERALSIASAASARGAKKSFASSNLSNNLKNLRKILLTAIENPDHPLTVKKIFRNTDSDKSGAIGMDELAAVLHKFKTFKDISSEDVAAMMAELDENGSNDISLDELESFLYPNGVPGAAAGSSKGGDDSGRSGGEADKIKKDARSLFIKEMNRIAQPDGVAALLADLDDDEDGLISLNSIVRLMRREEAFANRGSAGLTEDDARQLLSTMRVVVSGGSADDQVNVVKLLRFIENRSDDDVSNQDNRNSEIDSKIFSEIVDDYEFSDKLETRTLEKKIRNVGRTLSKRGMDVEQLFRTYDQRESGMIRRSEFIEVMSRMGLYVLEKGKVLEASGDGDSAAADTKRQQMAQIKRVKGTSYDSSVIGSTAGERGSSARHAARISLMGSGSGSGSGNNSGNHSGGGAKSEFADHLQSMALINSFRQSQKKQMLQRLLADSVAINIHVYPRFGQMLFFEHPLLNPFGHEERFIIDINRQEESELKLVTSYEEWVLLRTKCRPCHGEVGSDPIEAEMFDTDGYGNVQIVMLPQERLHIPFTFLSLKPASLSSSSSSASNRGGKGKYDDDDDEFSAAGSGSGHRMIEVKILSGTHGLVVGVLNVHVHPRDHIIHRTLRFFEPENSIMKRKLLIENYSRGGAGGAVGGVQSQFNEQHNINLFAHVVELETGNLSSSSANKVVVELGFPTASNAASFLDSIEMTLRYRCGQFPSTGNFYVLLYEDRFQVNLLEVWHIVIQSRQRLDLHGIVGNSSQVDLVVRGDRFVRRVRAFASLSVGDCAYFQPNTAFQLVPGAYNRVLMGYSFKAIGQSRHLINIVDVDSKELITTWILNTQSSAPVVMRSYDVRVSRGEAIMKKIIFKNPWNIPRKFTLLSSDDNVMRPRNPTLDVSPNGNAYLRLQFSALDEEEDSRDVYLFLNDESGQNEESYLFHIYS